MASNSEVLEAMSAERRGATAGSRIGPSGHEPVGGDPVPDATTAVGNTDPADIPSGKIENSRTESSTSNTGSQAPIRRAATPSTKASPAKT